MLHQIKHCYFNESDLDEMVPRKALAHALVTTMHEVEKHTHVVEVHLTLRELASIVLFEQFELEGTELYTNIGHLEEDEQHKSLERLFGKRIFRIVGPRDRVYRNTRSGSFLCSLETPRKSGTNPPDHSLKPVIFSFSVVSSPMTMSPSRSLVAVAWSLLYTIGLATWRTQQWTVRGIGM
jgi:hypothetical protein